MRDWLNKSEENRIKNRLRVKKWAEENKERAKINKRRRDLQARYGMTLEQWETMLEEQDCRCAICHTKSPGKHWHTDHCHTTGEVRGILCYKCNALLGMANDNVTTLYNAIKYLEK